MDGRFVPHGSAVTPMSSRQTSSPTRSLPPLETLLPTNLAHALYPYQREAVEFLLLRGCRGLLSLDMGLGKTVISICAVLAHIHRRRLTLQNSNKTLCHPTYIVVVCPAKVAQQFAAAIRRWTKCSKEATLVGTAAVAHVRSEATSRPTADVGSDPGRTRAGCGTVCGSADNGIKCSNGCDVSHHVQETVGRVRWCLVSYHLSRTFVPEMITSRLPVEGLICDESQTLKNIDSITVQSLLPLSRQASSVVLLSGIPMNVPRHIFPQLKILCPSAPPNFSDQKKFYHRFCGPRKVFISRDAYRWQYNGKSNEAELHAYLRERVMFRLTREDLTIRRGLRPGVPGRKRIRDGDVQRQDGQEYEGRDQKMLDSCDNRLSPLPPKSRRVTWVSVEGGRRRIQFHADIDDDSETHDDASVSRSVGCTYRGCGSSAVLQKLKQRRLDEVDVYQAKCDALRRRNREWAATRNRHDVKEAEAHEVDHDVREKQELFMRYRRNTAIQKIKLCRRFLVQYLRMRCVEKGEKVLLFGVHRRILTMLESIVTEALTVTSEGTASSPECAYDAAAAFVRQWDPKNSHGSDRTPAGEFENMVGNEKGSNPPQLIVPKSTHVHSLPYVRIDGVSGTGAQTSIDRFRQDPTCRVAVLSILAAGAGIEMQSANHVLFAELSFNADDLLQAEARAHRIGQVKPVEVTYLLLKDSVEEAVFDIVRRKLANIFHVLENRACHFPLTEDTLCLTAS